MPILTKSYGIDGLVIHCRAGECAQGRAEGTTDLIDARETAGPKVLLECVSWLKSRVGLRGRILPREVRCVLRRQFSQVSGGSAWVPLSLSRRRLKSGVVTEGADSIRPDGPLRGSCQGMDRTIHIGRVDGART
jgi:hypothetical protein